MKLKNCKTQISNIKHRDLNNRGTGIERNSKYTAKQQKKKSSGTEISKQSVFSF